MVQILLTFISLLFLHMYLNLFTCISLSSLPSSFQCACVYNTTYFHCCLHQLLCCVCAFQASSCPLYFSFVLNLIHIHFEQKAFKEWAKGGLNFEWLSSNLVANHSVLKPFPIGIAPHYAIALDRTRRCFSKFDGFDRLAELFFFNIFIISVFATVA